VSAPLWTATAAAEIGVSWLEREIAPVGDFGRRRREREPHFRRGDERAAREAIGLVVAVAALTPASIAAIRAAIAAAPDPGAASARAASGAVLTDVELFELSRFLDAIAEIGAALDPAVFPAEYVPPGDSELTALLAIGRTQQRTFYLTAAFDADLGEAREAVRRARVRYDTERGRLVQRIAAYAGVESLRDGEFVLMRDRVEGPLPQEIRVLREAPTYYLCDVALDDAALAALAALADAERRVAADEERARAVLSLRVGAAAPTLSAAADALGGLDTLLARAAFAQRYDARAPEISDAPALEFVDARFLPLSTTLAERAHRYVPLTLELDGVGVLTGPNMGGKSAALRTCGFVAACVALGLPVPAERARVALFDEIAHVGAADERGSLLSSFGQEVVQLRDVLLRGAERALVLIDEVGRTTSPREGRALLIALIETLRERGAIGLAATHLSGIAAAAGVEHFAVAGLRDAPAVGESLGVEDAIERIAAVMDFRIQRVAEDAATRADALALADALGLDATVVARARAAL
jgi:DNA mismatch repair protein MutS2